jgi:hypothetical protein
MLLEQFLFFVSLHPEFGDLHNNAHATYEIDNSGLCFNIPNLSSIVNMDTLLVQNYEHQTEFNKCAYIYACTDALINYPSFYIGLMHGSTYMLS